MRFDFEKTAQGGPAKSTPAPTQPPDSGGPDMPAPAGLNSLEPANANALQDAWIQHKKQHGEAKPFYAFDSTGHLFRIGPDNTGAVVTATPMVQSWKIDPQNNSLVYNGENAWNDLYEKMGYNFTIAPWLNPESLQRTYNKLANAWYVSKDLAFCARVVAAIRAPEEAEESEEDAAMSVSSMIDALLSSPKANPAEVISAFAQIVGNDTARTILRIFLAEHDLLEPLYQQRTKDVEWIG